MAVQLESAGEAVVESAGVATGDSVLDLACGAGNATIPAARRGASVKGLDLTPELLDAGRVAAERAGVEIEWVVGDAQDLPFGEGEFSVVLSTFGCMFAPDQRKMAREIVRVLAPGGRVALANWTPSGTIGDFFRTVGAHAPSPPPGFQPPPLWGDPDHVVDLFDGTGISLEFEERAVQFRFASAREALDRYAAEFGPIVSLRDQLEPEGRWQALLDDLEAFFTRVGTSTENGYAFRGDYLLVAGRKD